jgi:hypothetical protein
MHRLRLLRFLLALGAVGLCAAEFAPSAAAAGCDKVASTTGNDANPGTVSAPYRTAQRLADSLSSGQAGCLRAGTFVLAQTIVTRPGITVTSYPGERATIIGRFWVDADGVTVSNLNLNGSNTGNSPAVTATDVTFDDVDVTNNHTDGVCFVLGSTSGFGRAVHTVIENSRIHDCGPLPSGNQGHGIYVAQADGAVIRNNWIYDNVDRGIQLYPNSHGAHVYGNVIDGNGEGIIISGDGETASSDSLVENNLISNSRIRWNVESNWPGGVVGSGNVVRNNCLSASNSSSYFNQHGGILPVGEGGGGFASLGNVTVDSQFVAAATRNPGVLSEGPCSGSSVTLKPLEKDVQAGGNVGLTGHVSPATASHVTIQILRHRHWAKFGHTKLRADGSFRLRRHLSRRVASGRARLRAIVPQVGRSRPVVIRIRP